MTDRNMQDFQHRLHRIDEIHQAGGAFEAAGSLGRAYFDSSRPRSRRAIWLRPLALIFTSAMLLKGGLYAHLGAESYGERVDGLMAGGLADQVGAWMLKADPLTVFLAGYIRPLMG